MRTDLLNRYVVLVVGLLTMSLTPVWGVDVEISEFSFTTKGSSIPTGWSGSGTGNTSTGNYYFMGSNGSLTSPNIDFSKYSKVTITITGRRYSETNERTITAKVAGTTIGTTTTKGTTLTQLDLITLSSNLPTSSNPIVFTANSSSTTKGVGISKITITGTLKNIDPINVVLSRNGNITNITNQTPPYVLPGINEEPAACEGWEFKGWVKTNSVNSTTTPDFVTSVSESCTVYAVYGKTEMGGGTTSYIRVTDVAKIEVGTYAIAVDKVNSQKYNFANAEASSGNAGVEGNGTTKSDSYTTLPSGAVLYTLAGNNTDGFSIQEKETGKYLVATANKGSLSYAESATEKWTFTSAESTGGFYLTGKLGSKMSANSTTASSAIRNYASTGNFYSPLFFFKQTGGSTTTYKTSPDCAITYTAKVDPAPGNGTIVLRSTNGSWSSPNLTGVQENDEVTITLAPSEGYEVGSVTVTKAGGETVSVSGEGNSRTFTMPAENVTVSATFTCPTVTLTFQSPSKTETKTVSKCEAIGTNLPAAPAHCGDTYTHFVGWFTTPAGSDSNPDATAPATKVTAETIPTDDATYYAVFSDGTGESQWELVTSAAALEAGATYTIASTSTAKSGKALGEQNTNNRAAVDWSNTTNPTELKLGGDATNGWTFYDATNSGYLYSSGTSNSYLKIQKDLNVNGKWTIEIAASGSAATIKGKGENAYNWLRYNSSSTLFSCYANGQSNVYLFKKGGTATGYISSCCSDPAVVTIKPEKDTVNLGADGTATTTVTCSQKGGGAGTWKYSVSPAGASFDGMTFTATKVGTYTLTATYTETCPKSAKTTITVTATPTLYFTTEPADPIEFDDPKCGGNTPLEQKKSVALQGYNLTGNVTVTVSGDYKIARTSSAALQEGYSTSLTLNKTAEGKINANYQTIYILSTPPAAQTNATEGTLTITTEGGNTLKVNLSTPTITCAEYTLTFMDQGGKYKEVTQYAGTDVAEPTPPTGVCTEPTEYIFDGWAERTVNAENEYTKVDFDTYTMPKNGATLYAVYRYAEDGALGNDYELIPSLEELDSGADYVIAAYANSSDYALKNVVNSDGKAESVKVVCNKNNITTTDKTIIWKITGNSTEGYTFYNDACKKYIDFGLSGTQVILNLTESPTYKYIIDITSDEEGYVSSSITSTINKTYNVFSYYNSLFEASSSFDYYIFLYKRVVAYKYTTSPACGPHIGLSGDVRITSAKDVRVDAYTKITVSGTNLDKNEDAAAVSIKAESNNAKFKIKRWGTPGDGNDAYSGNSKSWTLATNILGATYTDSLCITYTPTAFNAFDTATITLTAYRYNGSTVYATKTITVLGHSLPERFVIAAKGNDGWVALPNTLGSNSSALVPSAEDIKGDVYPTDNPTKLNTAPSNVIYTAAARGDSYKNNSQTGLRFTVDGGQFLQASKNETEVWLSTTGSKDMQSWTLRTEDFTDYVVRLDSGSRYNRSLSYYKNATTERIGHYTTNTAIRFLPFDTECTRLLAPANLKVTQVKSSAITLAWDAVAGAIGYKYSIDGGTTWKEMGNVLTYTITGLDSEKAYTILVKGVVPVGDTDCSYYGTVLAKTTNCDDVPQNISYTSDVNSITLSWTMTSATATVQVFSDEKGTTQVGSYKGKSSPYTIKGLAKATTYYVKILAGGSCPSELVEISTERPQLDVVEWKPDGIDVAINTNEKISVILENQVTKGSGKGKVADDLFFSKYFEAHSTNKMLGIYNGTPNKIALAAYSIAISAGGEFSLSRFGKETGYIDAGEEIILVQYSSTNSAKTCAQEQEGWEDWFETQSSGDEGQVMQMSGRQSLGLYKNSVLIDVIGSSTSNDGMGQLNELDKDGCSSSKLIIEGIAVNDAPSFFSMQGDNISTENIETDYALTTNRCLLVRKNSVTSGKDAVLKNVTTSSVCADISASFVTLGEEWMGLRIGSGKSSNTEIQEATCTGLSYLGHFDYSGYYTTYDSLTTIEFTESDRKEDGTITIPIPRMDTLACKGLKIIAADEGGNVLTTKDYKVPILVTSNATTADKIFSHFGGDTCKTCDVVVRDKATLTKAEEGTPNDKPQVRDVKIYEGASLVVPSGTNYTVNSLSLRRKEDAVSTVDVAGTLTFSNTSGKPVYLDLRINAENWHWFTLPYDCAIADVTWSNGQPAEFRKDWFLMYYDGARRATGVDSGNWKEYEGTTIAAGQGFIVGIKGDGNDKHAYELRFPMAKEVITAEKENKDVAGMKAYGAGTDIRPNHKGWNLVGNPYLNYYKRGNINSFDGLQLSKLIYDPVTGWYSLGTDNNPYVVIPQNFGWSAYEQVLVSSQDLLPFTSYFIQVGKDGDIDGKDYSVNFISSNRGKSAKAALMTSAAEEVEEEPVITGIVLRNAQGEQDETSLVIAERFGSSYEMGADFFKWFGDYYKYYTLPVLYSIGDDGGKRAFNAVNEEGAKQSIPLGMYAARDGQYTFSLNTRSDLSRVDKVWLYDAESGRYTDLLREDYTFATMRTEGSGRFFLSVVLKEKEITTSAANTRHGDLTLYADKQTLIVRGLPEAAEVWVYDPSGKLLHHEQTRHYERQYDVPQQGTYLVRVESQDGGVTLRGVCR